MISIFFIVLVIFLIIGIPVGITLGAASVLYIIMAGIPPMIIVQKLFSGIDSTSLLAIPFFILAGDLMNRGGIAKRLVDMANAYIGRLTGGLAIVTIVGCMFFAAISGSGVATAAALGAIMIPEMVKNGYDREFSSAIVAAGSPIGVIIPPSVAFVVYASLTQCSVADLYLVGIPAGIMMGIVLIGLSIFHSRKEGYIGLKGKTTLKEKLILTRDALWALGTPIILIGGVFAGIFTPTESAVIAVAYALIIGLFIYKDLNIKDLPSIFLSSARTIGKIMFIIGNATLFAYVLAYEQIPQKIIVGFLNISASPIVILLIINVIFLIAGMVMETTAIYVILVPLLWPVAQALGIDVIHFGIVITVNTAIGLLSPPFGVVMFTAASIGDVPIEKLSKKVLPFIAVMIVVLLIITFIPETVLFLLN
ncbi:MAG: TRAP transporter large permease [Eubacteriales bacterium]